MRLANPDQVQRHWSESFRAQLTKMFPGIWDWAIFHHFNAPERSPYSRTNRIWQKGPRALPKRSHRSYLVDNEVSDSPNKEWQKTSVRGETNSKKSFIEGQKPCNLQPRWNRIWTPQKPIKGSFFALNSPAWSIPSIRWSRSLIGWTGKAYDQAMDSRLAQSDREAILDEGGILLGENSSQ